MSPQLYQGPTKKRATYWIFISTLQGPAKTGKDRNRIRPPRRKRFVWSDPNVGAACAGNFLLLL